MNVNKKCFIVCVNGIDQDPNKTQETEDTDNGKKLSSGKQILAAVKLKSRGHSINRTRLISETKRSLKVPRKSSGQDEVGW